MKIEFGELFEPFCTQFDYFSMTNECHDLKSGVWKNSYFMCLPFFASIQVEICHDFLVQCLKLSIKLALPKLPAYGRSREDRHPYVMCLIWMNVVLHKNELLKITSQMMMLSLWGCYLKHWGGLPGNFRMLPTSTSFQTMQIEE